MNSNFKTPTKKDNDQPGQSTHIQMYIQVKLTTFAKAKITVVLS